MVGKTSVYRELKQKLVEGGFLEKLKPGRPPIYHTDEERLAALREQKKACSKRHSDRLREARTRLAASLSSDESHMLALTTP